MQRRNIAFPEPLLVRAEKIAKDSGVKLPDIVRRALEEFVERREQMDRSK